MFIYLMFTVCIKPQCNLLTRMEAVCSTSSVVQTNQSTDSPTNQPTNQIILTPIHMLQTFFQAITNRR